MSDDFLLSILQDLLNRVLEFREEAQEALDAETPDSEQVEGLIEFGIGLDVDLPEIPKLKQVNNNDFCL